MNNDIYEKWGAKIDFLRKAGISQGSVLLDRCLNPYSTPTLSEMEILNDAINILKKLNYLEGFSKPQ